MSTVIKFQKRAAMPLLDNPMKTPSVELFTELKWMMFPDRVRYQKAILIYKIIHNLAQPYFSNIFNFSSEVHTRALRSSVCPKALLIQDLIYGTQGGITPEEDREDLTTSWKIEGRSENVVKMKPFQVYKIILRPYHVLTTFAPRPCQVFTTPIRFPMSSYHALSTLIPFIVRSYYVLNTTKQTAIRACHAFSTF